MKKISLFLAVGLAVSLCACATAQSPRTFTSGGGDRPQPVQTLAVPVTTVYFYESGDPSRAFVTNVAPAPAPLPRAHIKKSTKVRPAPETAVIPQNCVCFQNPAQVLWVQSPPVHVCPQPQQVVVVERCCGHEPVYERSLPMFSERQPSFYGGYAGWGGYGGYGGCDSGWEYRSSSSFRRRH